MSLSVMEVLVMSSTYSTCASIAQFWAEVETNEHTRKTLLQLAETFKAASGHGIKEKEVAA